MNKSLEDIHFDQESSLIDLAFGFRIREIEEGILKKAREQLPDGNHFTWGEKLHGGSQTWVGLHEETLQTPYEELKLACDYISPKVGETLVDLGSGYGRLGLLLEKFYPGVGFLGFELVPERVSEGNRIFQEFQCKTAKLYEQDLTREDFIVPLARYYFLYDYGKVAHIRRTLDQLSEIANGYDFVIIARGKGVRSLIEKDYPWLTVHDPWHQKHFSIYQTSFGQF